jgi:hypothetical protein
MSQNPEIDPDATWNAQIDESDARVAWNFGTRELTEAEYAEFADANRRDLERVYAAREADETYAKWAHANPDAAVRYEADFRAAERSGGPRVARPWLEPEPELEIG